MEYTEPMRFAHRGMVQAAPENTLGAYKAAVEAGFEGMEIDIQMSSDGEIICVHDGDFSFMTDGMVTTKICEMTAAEIKAVKLHYRNRMLNDNPPYPWTEHEGNRCRVNTPEENENRTCNLITFKEFDEWLGTVDADVTVEVEFKARGMMPRIAEILSTSKNIHRYIFFSGVGEINDEIQGWYREHKKPDGLRFGANIRWINEDTMAFVESADLWEVGLNNEAFTKEDVEMLAAKGIRVFSNLGDYPEWWAQLKKLGVTGFKTNYPAAYTRWKETNE